MKDENPLFSKEQWLFLCVLAVIEETVSIELAGILVPLLPGPLIDLLIRAEASGWLSRIGKDGLCIGRNLPQSFKDQLQSDLTGQFFSSLIARIHSENLAEKIGSVAMIRLLDRAGRSKEAGELEYQLAKDALQKNEHEKGRSHLMGCMLRLQQIEGDEACGAIFVAATLRLSSLCFAQGKGLVEIDGFLHQAHEVAARLGDKRSHALINLHLGRLYYFTDRREQAMVALSIGTQEIESLGDVDIQSQSAVFVGLHYFSQGLFHKSLEFLDIAGRDFETTQSPFLEHPTTPLLIGYCVTYLGQFHRAIGMLDYFWRLSRERSDKAMSSTIGAVLGLVLVLIKKPQKAAFHLKQATNDAKEVGNALGLYFCGGAMALQHFLDGRFAEAYGILKQTFIEGSRAGVVRQFSSPWILEMLYEFHHRGFEPIPNFHYPDVAERILDGINCHLQGVALRLRARDHMIHGGHRRKILDDLEQSKEYLAQSGDPVELSKTLLEMARVELGEGNQTKARELAQNARRTLGGYFEEFFPATFLHLLENQVLHPSKADSSGAFFENYLEMIESLYPSEDRTDILNKVLTATSRMFGAERSGLFWFPGGSRPGKPELRAASNLSQLEATSKDFRPSHDLVITAQQTHQPQVKTITIKETALGKKVTRSVLCIPIEVEGLVPGVLYYDNSYLENAFEYIDLSLAKRMASHTNRVIEQRFKHLKTVEKITIMTSENRLRQESDRKRIITKSPNMLRLLAQVDQIAGTESTILLTGETGTGKELIAKHIHEMGARSSGPFVVVDSTTIPENLLESELFGHEKGAFTGADNRKIGRIEIANQGTLFLDEVGELTLQAQAKLLRALQEKTFNRLGGTRTLHSDFRLIAATHRDLLHEVSKRRFREDLFYRLNVVPIHIPPLRERGNDPLLLSRHFIGQYARKYNRQLPELSLEDEKRLSAYGWPGNIRELKNMIERAVILSQGDRLELDFPVQRDQGVATPFSDRPSLEEMQCRYIRYILEQTGGKISGPGGAADILGMKRTSLYTRMKALGMKKESRDWISVSKLRNKN